MHMSAHICDVHRQRITQTEPKEHLIGHNHKNYKGFFCSIILFFQSLYKESICGITGFFACLFCFYLYGTYS